MVRILIALTAVSMVCSIAQKAFGSPPYNSRSAAHVAASLIPKGAATSFSLFSVNTEKKDSAASLLSEIRSANEKKEPLAIGAAKLDSIKKILSEVLDKEVNLKVDGLLLIIVSEETDSEYFEALFKGRKVCLKHGILPANQH